MIEEDRLRICVVAPAIAPLVGGAESIAEVLTLSLLDRGVTVRLVCGNEPRAVVRCAVEASGGSVDVVSIAIATAGQVSWESAVFGRAEMIYGLLGEVDVVHALSHDAALSAAIARGGAVRRPPIVITFSELSTEDSGFGRRRSEFIHTLPIDAAIHLSERYRRIAENRGCHPAVVAVTAAVDTVLFASGDPDRGRRILGLSPQHRLVACPSRFTRRKGQVDFVRAVGLLPRSLVDETVFALLGSSQSGDPAYEQELRHACAHSSAQWRVTAVGRDDLPDVFAACTLVVQPSYNEGLGFSVLEAMAAGVPVIATNVDGFREIPSGVGEPELEIVMPGNPDQLAYAIQTLMANPERRSARIKAGRRRAEAFGRIRFGRAATSVYQEVLMDGIPV